MYAATGGGGPVPLPTPAGDSPGPNPQTTYEKYDCLDYFWKQVAKFVFNVSNQSTLLSGVYATGRHRQAVATLKILLIHNPSLDRFCATHFLPFSTL